MIFQGRQRTLNMIDSVYVYHTYYLPRIIYIQKRHQTGNAQQKSLRILPIFGRNTNLFYFFLCFSLNQCRESVEVLCDRQSYDTPIQMVTRFPLLSGTKDAKDRDIGIKGGKMILLAVASQLWLVVYHIRGHYR